MKYTEKNRYLTMRQPFYIFIVISRYSAVILKILISVCFVILDIAAEYLNIITTYIGRLSKVEYLDIDL